MEGGHGESERLLGAPRRRLERRRSAGLRVGLGNTIQRRRVLEKHVLDLLLGAAQDIRLLDSPRRTGGAERREAGKLQAGNDRHRGPRPGDSPFDMHDALHESDI